MSAPTLTPKTDPPVSGPTVLRRLTTLISLRAVVLIAATMILVVYFDQATGGLFITTTNVSLLLRQAAVVAIVAAGVAVLIIMAEIDLSIGSTVFFTGLVAAQAQVAGWNVIVSILAAVGVGLAIGAVQGFVVVRFGVPSFVVTLAGLLIWRGAGLLWTNASAVGPVTEPFTALTEGTIPLPISLGIVAVVVIVGGFGIAANYRTMRRDDVVIARGRAVLNAVGVVLIALCLLWVASGKLGLPTALPWIVVVGGVLAFVMTRSKFGRRAFVVGSSREAARYAGISAPRTVFAGFVMMGVIYGIAGVMSTARLASSTADSNVSLELTAIAAAVIGGNALKGGSGSIVGAIAGAVLLATIDNGLSFLGVSTYAQDVVKGLILLVAVGIDGYFNRRRASA